LVGFLPSLASSSATRAHDDAKQVGSLNGQERGDISTALQHLLAFTHSGGRRKPERYYWRKVKKLCFGTNKSIFRARRLFA